jgi:hypothetical protein
VRVYVSIVPASSSEAENKKPALVPDGFSSSMVLSTSVALMTGMLSLIFVTVRVKVTDAELEPSDTKI